MMQLSEKTVKSKQLYNRFNRGFGILWGVLTVFLTILLIVAFAVPEWLGDTDDSSNGGNFGVFRHCEITSEGRQCSGLFGNFGTILNSEFRATTFFVGISCLIMLILTVCFLFFFFVDYRYVFLVSGVAQLIVGIFVLIGCLIYPFGWHDTQVQKVCGSGAGRFQPGTCRVRWGYILAIIVGFDALMLSFLALVLGETERQVLKWMAQTSEKNSNVAEEDNEYRNPRFTDNASAYSQPTTLRRQSEQYSLPSQKPQSIHIRRRNN